MGRGWAAPFPWHLPVIEEYTVRFLDMLAPYLAGVSPPVYVGALLGVMNSSIFYLFFGRGLKLFLPYLVLGAAGALVGLSVGGQLPESGPMLGEVHAAGVTIGAWIILFIARSLRL